MHTYIYIYVYVHICIYIYTNIWSGFLPVYKCINLCVWHILCVCNTLQQTAANWLQHTATHCNTLHIYVSDTQIISLSSSCVMYIESCVYMYWFVWLTHTCVRNHSLQNLTTWPNRMFVRFCVFFWIFFRFEFFMVCKYTVCCSVLQCASGCCNESRCVAVCCSVLQCVAVNVLQCVAVCWSVLHCAAECCSPRKVSKVSHYSANICMRSVPCKMLVVLTHEKLFRGTTRILPHVPHWKF